MRARKLVVNKILRVLRDKGGAASWFDIDRAVNLRSSKLTGSIKEELDAMVEQGLLTTLGDPFSPTLARMVLTDVGRARTKPRKQSTTPHGLIALRRNQVLDRIKIAQNQLRALLVMDLTRRSPFEEFAIAVLKESIDPSVSDDPTGADKQLEREVTLELKRDRRRLKLLSRLLRYHCQCVSAKSLARIERISARVEASCEALAQFV